MNEEMRRNQEYMTVYRGSTVSEAGYDKVVEVDRHKATYRGKPLCELGSFEKRKFENLLALHDAHERVKITYTI